MKNLSLIATILIALAGLASAQDVTGFGSNELNPVNTVNGSQYFAGWSGTVGPTNFTVTDVSTMGGMYQVLPTPITPTNTGALILTGAMTKTPTASFFFITFYDAANNAVGYKFFWNKFTSTTSSVQVDLNTDSTVGTLQGPIVAYEIDNSGNPGDTVSFVFDKLTFTASTDGGSGGGDGGGSGSGTPGTTKQTITFPAIATQAYSDGKTVALNATATSGQQVTYSVISGPATVSGSTVTLTGAGTVTIQANQAGNSTYAAAAPVNKAFIVTKGIATVSLSNLAATYNTSAQTPTVTTTPSGLNVTLTYTGKTTAPTNAGSYAVVATVSDPSFTGTAKGTLVIGKATATVDVNTTTVSYNGLGHAATTITTTTPPGLLVTFTYNAKATLPVLVGTYTVVGTINNANYTGSGQGTMTVVPAPAVAYQGATDAEVTQGVMPGAGATSAYYVYGISPSFGSQTASQNIGAGKVPINVYALFPGLQPDTTYYYQLMTVTNGVTTAVGGVLHFHTLNFDTNLVIEKGTAATGTNGAFNTFGNPAVNVDDKVAFTATLALSVPESITAANSTGIWTVDNTNTQALIARVGSPAVGTTGNFVTLNDPLINDAGNVAFRATAGKPVLAGIFCTDNTGTLQQIALQGAVAPNTNGGKFATFTSLGLTQTAGPVAYATMTVNAAAGITAANYAGIFEGTTSANFQPVLRLGDVVGGKTIVKIVFQSAVLTVNGQSRAFNASGGIVAQATFSDKTIGIVSVIGGTKTLVAVTGLAVPTLSNNHFVTLDTPAIDNAGTVSFEATTNSTTQPMKRNVFTTDGSGGFTFGSNNGTLPADPVINNSGKTAYLSNTSVVSGATTVLRNAVYMQNTPVAIQGSQAPGCPAGANFNTFTELALPDQGGADNHGGVVFMGTLAANAAAGVNATNATGIWAVDNSGSLQLVVRTGDILNGKTITALSFLPSPLYVVGSSRSVAQANGDLVYMATFSDKSTAIFSVVFP